MKVERMVRRRESDAEDAENESSDVMNNNKTIFEQRVDRSINWVFCMLGGCTHSPVYYAA